MKKIYIFGLFVLLLSFGGSVYADQCTPPTPSACYQTQTVPIYSSTGPQSDGSIVLPNGDVLLSGGRGTVQNQKQVQVQVTCSGSGDIQYQAQMESYNVCLQLNTMEANRNDLNSYTDSAIHKEAQAPLQDYTQVCPLPTQPASQASQKTIDTADTTFATFYKYPDGTYAMFTINGLYLSTATQDDFDTAKQNDKDMELLSQTTSSLSLRDLLMKIDLEDIKIKNKQNAVDKWLSDKNNCPDATPLQVYNSLIGSSPDSLICPSDSLGIGNVDSNGKLKISSCVTYTSRCQKKYGPNSYGDRDYCHVCHDGYTVNSENNACVPVVPTKVNPSAETSSQTNTSPVTLTVSNPPTQSATTKSINIIPPKIPKIYSVKIGSSTQNIVTNATASSSVIVKTPSIKHWYQWLNPFSWFKK